MNSIGFIGAGNMGEALIKGILSASPQAQIGAIEPNTERAKYIYSNYAVTLLTEYSDLSDYDIIIVAIKPQTIHKVMAEIATYIASDSLVISIAAGISIGFYSNLLPKNPIVRIMPNTPALIKEGMSGIAFSDNCNKKNKEDTKKIFKNIGEVLVVPEKLINIVTALSGSGPAYFYYIAHLFASAASDKNISYDDALLLISKTMLGASKMILSSNSSPEQLINMVTSPGGTTEAALKVLKNSNISDIINSTISAAEKRAEELS